MSPTQAARLVSVATELIEDAECRYQVTASMLKKALKLKCREKTILQALHARGVWFHAFREKPLLTEGDVVARLAFASAHGRKSVTFWAERIHAYLDEKGAEAGIWLKVGVGVAISAKTLQSSFHILAPFGRSIFTVGFWR